MSRRQLPADATAKVAAPQWTVPSGWQPGQQSSIRRGSFVASGPDGQTADIAVTVFPGDVGGPAMNINRWRSQIGLPPVPNDQAVALASKLDVSGVEATLVDLAADKPADGKSQPARMIVVTIPQAGNSWFFKITGDAPLVAAQKDAFLQFVKSAKF